jgi:hypothetical protein
MTTNRNLAAVCCAEQESECSAYPSIAQNIRNRRPDLEPTAVEDLATFWGHVKEGVYRHTSSTVPAGDPLTRRTRVCRRQQQLDQTRPASTDEVAIIARSSEVGREAVARGLRALLVRLESVRRGPAAIPAAGLKKEERSAR